MSSSISQNGIPRPEDRRDAALRARKAEESEAKARRDALEREIQDLVQQRFEKRMAASDSAGALGLAYSAEENSFVRIVRKEPGDAQLWEPPPRPEPLAPPPAEPAVVPESIAVPKKPSKIVDGLLWIFAAAVGSLIGLGLMTLVGFSWRRDAWVLPAGAVLGICVLGALKVLVSTLWGHAGRESVLSGKGGTRFVVASLATVGGCALDAHLGALAMREYIRARELSESAVPPYVQLFFLALAVTCPLLLASGARAYVVGKAEPTAEERAEKGRLEALRKREAEAELAAARRLEHHEERNRLLQEAYRDRFSAWEQARRAAEEEDREREEEWDFLKGSTEFRCLQGLISQIATLTQEIEERQRKLTSLSISEGYQRSAERKANDSRAGARPPWVENRVPDETAAEAADGEAVASLQ